LGLDRHIIHQFSNANFRSYGYAGGTNADRRLITPGGFDPILTLFDPDDKYIEYQNGSPSGLPDFDFTRIFSRAGTYRAVISAFPNFFEYYNYPNFSAAGFPGGGVINGQSLAYAFDITTTPTSVPEPSSSIVTAIAGFATVLVRRKLASDRQTRD
jgi:hypothetical protein